MPPRHAYWTILVGDSPTAFRSADRADLLPTFERLKQKHPDVVLKWFARGQLWESQEAQRAAERPARPTADREGRGPEWRPGGSHRDPRDRFKPKPREDRDRGARPDRPRPDRPREDRPPRDDRGDRSSRPPQGRPWVNRESRGRPPFGKPPGRSFDKPQGRPFDKPQGKPFGKPPGKPYGDRPPFDKAQGRPFRDQRPRRPWAPKDAPAPPPQPPPKEDVREEKARKGGTRLVKKFKR